jgi:tRNA pseudouridine55 synthase
MMHLVIYDILLHIDNMSELMGGFLLINKPTGPTSHDIVDRVRRLTREDRVGHAGTLDPFATGLLIVGVGREATREFPKLVGLDKRYVATLRFGATSDTDDRTGKIIVNDKNSPYPLFFKEGEKIFIPPLEQGRVGRVLLDDVLKKFTGKIQQVPPMYSAKKIHGKKMYELARAGQTVERAPVQIEIFSIQVTSYKLQAHELVLDIHCGSGTYIRALARDIGEALGCGAYLEELERAAVGPFALGEAVEMEGLSKENWKKYLKPISLVLARSKENSAS